MACGDCLLLSLKFIVFIIASLLWQISVRKSRPRCATCSCDLNEQRLKWSRCKICVTLSLRVFDETFSQLSAMIKDEESEEIGLPCPTDEEALLWTCDGSTGRTIVNIQLWFIGIILSPPLTWVSCGWILAGLGSECLPGPDKSYSTSINISIMLCVPGGSEAVLPI